MDHRLTFDPVSFEMWRRCVPTERGRKKALKGIEDGTRVLFVSPSPEEQPEEQIPKGQPSKSDRQMRKRRVRQRAAKRKSPR